MVDDALNALTVSVRSGVCTVSTIGSKHAYILQLDTFQYSQAEKLHLIRKKCRLSLNGANMYDVHV